MKIGKETTKKTIQKLETKNEKTINGQDNILIG